MFRFPTFTVYSEGTKLCVTITSQKRLDISYHPSWKLNPMASSRRENITQNKGMMESKIFLVNMWVNVLSHSGGKTVCYSWVTTKEESFFDIVRKCKMEICLDLNMWKILDSRVIIVLHTSYYGILVLVFVFFRTYIYGYMANTGFRYYDLATLRIDPCWHFASICQHRLNQQYQTFGWRL